MFLGDERKLENPEETYTDCIDTWIIYLFIFENLNFKIWTSEQKKKNLYFKEVHSK